MFRSMKNRIVVPVVAGLVAIAGLGRAQEAPPSPAPAPSPTPVASEASRLQIHGVVDVPYAYNSNQPADHANFFTGVGTSAKRADEFSVNLAQLDVSIDPAPIGFRLALGFGTGTEVVHGFEPGGTAAGSEVWKNVIQASLQFKTSVGRGLLLEAGIYPSHIGMESLASKDNWNYTRSWLGELSPYYQTGLKIAYPFSDPWSAQLHLLNGWQTIADNNGRKSVGAQLAYASDRLSLSFNGIAGPELRNDDDEVRVLGDVVATWKATPRLSFGFSGDVAREGRPTGESVSWAGLAVHARLAPPDSRTALALRGELYDDGDGAISGFAQTLHEITLTLEHHPAKQLIVKLEGRYDHSSADVFATDQTLFNNSPVRKGNQFLLLVGAVATF
jgi:hypothetical protein